MSRNGEAQAVRPKTMAVLCVLAHARGSLVTRDELLDQVWGPRAVSDEPLTATIGELRRLLGDRRGSIRYIETVPKRGYRLLPEVAALDAAPARSVTAPTSPKTAATRRTLPFLAIVGAVLALLVSYAVFRTDPVSRDREAPRAVAVLPFTSPSGGEAGAIFGEAVAQEILTSLTRVQGLRVAARQSTLAVAEQRSDLAGLRRVLDVCRARRTGHHRRGADTDSCSARRPARRLQPVGATLRGAYRAWAGAAGGGRRRRRPGSRARAHGCARRSERHLR